MRILTDEEIIPYTYKKFHSCTAFTFRSPMLDTTQTNISLDFIYTYSGEGCEAAFIHIVGNIYAYYVMGSMLEAVLSSTEKYLDSSGCIRLGDPNDLTRVKGVHMQVLCEAIVELEGVEITTIGV